MNIQPIANSRTAKISLWCQFAAILTRIFGQNSQLLQCKMGLTKPTRLLRFVTFVHLPSVSIKYGLRTTHYGLRTTDYGLRTTDYGLRTTDYGLRTTDYGLRTGYKTRTKHYGLGIKYGLRYKTRTEHYGLSIKHVKRFCIE